MNRDIEIPDLRERGGEKDGEQQFSDQRLFMQLLVFDECEDSNKLKFELNDQSFQSVLYQHINNPHRVGLLTFNTDVNFFIGLPRSV